MSDTTNARLKVALVINNPTPFRIPVFQLASLDPRVDLTVIFCARREPGRPSDVPDLPFPHIVLKERYTLRDDAYSVHNNPDIWGHLVRLSPDVVINNGYQPTNIYAYLYARIYGRRHVVFTDGTVESERSLGRVHRLLRKAFASYSTAFLGPNNGTRRLFLSYGVDPQRVFNTPLGVDNQRFRLAGVEKRYDLIFCSRMAPIKRPLLALDVAEALARRLNRDVTILFVGAGPMEQAVRDKAAAVQSVKTTITGFSTQAQLPQFYNEARLFVFPTSWDPWGVVVNEACASGLPILVTPHAGVVGELVEDGVNGFVLDDDPERWAEAAARLLTDDLLYARFSNASREMVGAYTYEAGAQGIVDAALRAADWQADGATSGQKARVPAGG